MAKGIIIGGKVYELGPVLVDRLTVPVQVLTWHDTGIEFRPGQGFNKKRRQEIRQAVWHWTGSENRIPQMITTLRKRGYGVEWAISADTPIIWQFCDPMEVDTADVGGLNATSVGIEIVNFGYKQLPAWLWPKTDRHIYAGKIHNKRYPRLAGFYPWQIACACALADKISEAIPGVLRKVPEMADGSINTRVLANPSSFSGHMGHLNVSPAKIDPGIDLLQAFQARFSESTT